MTSRAKKLIIISTTSLVAVIIALLLTWPLIFVYYLTHIQKGQHLDVKPVIITTYERQSNNSYLHDIGLIKANLLPPAIKEIEINNDNFTKIEYESFSLIILPWENVTQYKELQFAKRFEVLNTTPADIKLFKSMERNITLIINLILKAISATTDNIEIINTDSLNIISLIHINQNKTNKVMIDVYDNNNVFMQSFILVSAGNQEETELQYNKFINTIIPSDVDESFEHLMKSLGKNLEHIINST